MKVNIFAVYCSITDDISIDVTRLDMSSSASWMKIGETEIEAPEFNEDEIKVLFMERIRKEKLAEIEKLKAEL